MQSASPLTSCWAWPPQATVALYDDGSRCCSAAAAAAGCFDGRGSAIFASGARYESGWVQGHMHGAGAISWPDGVVYEGSFAGDALSGSGVRR